jgi:hypothetical protein
MTHAEKLNNLDYEQMYNQLFKKCAAQEALICKLQSSEGYKVPPFSNSAYDFLKNLQYKVKSLAAQVEAFKSGEKYSGMMENHKARLAEKDREIKRLKQELAKANCQVVDVRRVWEQIVADLEVGHAKELLKKDREIKALDGKLLKTQIMLDGEKDRFRGKARELYKVMTALEDEKGKNQKLKAQINRDYENSSTPSSQNPNRKKITNNREKTGRKPGGQVGHKGHLRKKHAPTNFIEIPAPEKYANNSDYKPTGRTITKQVVGIKVNIVVDEYSTPQFRNVRTGQRVHAAFPDGVADDVNYDGSIKAFAFLLNNYCNVALSKVADFLSELTGGALKISTGMINGLSKQFSSKTDGPRRKAFADILLSPVVNTDFTAARVNGKNVNVAVCATLSDVMYFAREHKGHEGVKGTPVEDGSGILVHDHDKTFYNYGDAHQECLDHVSRYLKDSISNEPGLKWNLQMRGLIQEMIHFRKSLDPDDDRDPDEISPAKVEELESRYDKILALAKEEYEYEPPSKYYKEGYNLYKRLFEYKDCHLLFLHDRRVPHTNNLAERLLRVFKRKQRQVMSFRSFESLACLCQSMGIVASLRSQGKSLHESVSSIFGLAENRDGNATGQSHP